MSDECYVIAVYIKDLCLWRWNYEDGLSNLEDAVASLKQLRNSFPNQRYTIYKINVKEVPSE